MYAAVLLLRITVILPTYFDLLSKLAHFSSIIARVCLYTYCFITVYSALCCCQFGYNDQVQGTVSDYGPYSSHVWQLGLDGGVTMATLVLCCHGWISPLYEGLRAKLRKHSKYLETWWWAYQCWAG